MLLDVPKHVEFHGDLADFTPATIAKKDMGLAQEFFASIYTRRRDAVLRELAANAADAIAAAGTTTPVLVQLPTAEEPCLVIADQGTGMTLDELITNQCGYLKSTKRTEATQRGGFGVGSKTPHAVADSFTTITIKDGQRHEAIFAKLPTGGTGYSIVSSGATDQPSGTTIVVPFETIDAEEAAAWRDAAARTFYWWEPKSIFYPAAGEYHPSFRDDVQHHASLVSNASAQVIGKYPHAPAASTSIIVRINSVAYDAPQHLAEKALGELGHYLRTLVLNGDGAPLQISRNRESIEDTDEAKAWLATAVMKWRKASAQAYFVAIDHLATARQLANHYVQLPETTRDLINPLLHPSGLSDIAHGKDLNQGFTAPVSVYRPGQKVWRWAPAAYRNYEHDLIKYAYGNRSPVNTGQLQLINDMADGLFITETDFRALSKAGFARWRKSDRARTLTVINPERKDLKRIFTEAEITWITAEKLAEQFPAPERTAKPITINRLLTDNSWQTRKGLLFNEAQTPEEFLASIEEGQPIIAGIDAEFSQGFLDPKKHVMIARGSRTVARLSEILDREVISYETALERAIELEVQAMTPKQRRFISEMLSLGWRPHQAQTLTSKQNLDDRAIKALLPLQQPTIDGGTQYWWPSRLLEENPGLATASKLLPKPKFKDNYPLACELIRAAGYNSTGNLINAVIAADESA